MLTDLHDRSPYDCVRLAQPGTTCVESGGALLYATAQPLRAYPVNFVSHLWHWASRQPDVTFLATREGSRWREWSYGTMMNWATRLSSAMLDTGADRSRPLVLVDHNTVEHAVITLAAMQVGISIVPVSPTWLSSEIGLAKLRKVLEIVEPVLIYVGRHLPRVSELAAPQMVNIAQFIDPSNTGRFASTGDSVEGKVKQVTKMAETVTHDTIAKILFTSGSTGDPKGVINTHGMLCAQQQQMAQLWSFLDETPPVLCDWLPWNHTSGGNNSFNMVLRNGGTLFVDTGKPTASGILTTLSNLTDVRPTWHTNVPLGYSMLLPHLEASSEAASAFFARLQLMVYGGAPLSNEVWTRLDQLARRTTGRGVAWASGWGLTETTSTTTITHYPVRRAGIVGVPLPGMELKLQPHRDFFVAHVRGPNVTPGYYKDPILTAQAFDAEGFFCTGDLVNFSEPRDPNQGLDFVGRLTEEFKLGTGIWVIPGRIKSNLLRCTGPLVKDVVVAGPGQDFLTVCLWLNEELAMRDYGWSASTDDAHPHCAAVLRWLDSALDEYHKVHSGASERVHRACILRSLPSLVAGELTEKGSINQTRFLTNRSLFAKQQYSAAQAQHGFCCTFEPPIIVG